MADPYFNGVVKNRKNSSQFITLVLNSNTPYVSSWLDTTEYINNNQGKIKT